MKDAVVNLLVFLLVFLLVAAFFLAEYQFGLALVPGGKGLVFANPFAGALFPALLIGLVAAQSRSVKRPGRFVVTWLVQAVAFFLLLTLPLPWLTTMPSVRAVDSSPLVDQRFVPLDDGSLIVRASPEASILIPAEGGTMTVSSRTQFDPLNQRFVFAEGEPRALGSTGPERAYFQYTDALFSLQRDLLGIYTVLKDNARLQPLVFWAQAAAITVLFLGFYFFFSLKTWPLVRLVLVLLFLRLAVAGLVYAFWGLPALLGLWFPSWPALATWGPIVLVGVAASSLVFMTMLTKPHRQEAS